MTTDAQGKWPDAMVDVVEGYARGEHQPGQGTGMSYAVRNVPGHVT